MGERAQISRYKLCPINLSSLKSEIGMDETESKSFTAHNLENDEHKFWRKGALFSINWIRVILKVSIRNSK